MRRIFMMSGIPGSGKSYYATTHATGSDKVISRDEIRFALLDENDQYFDKEEKVFSKWINTINEAIEDPNCKNIYLDATHLNDVSRLKTLSQLKLNKVDEIILVMVDTTLETCLERNSKRIDRKRVPDNVIKNMYKSFKPYTENELFIGTILLREG